MIALPRRLMLIVASMDQAWTPYDDKAVGSALGGALRKTNEEIAIGYATCWTSFQRTPRVDQRAGAEARFRS